jgi:hypothetical protein
MKREDTSGAAHEDCGRASRDAVKHNASREKGDGREAKAYVLINSSSKGNAHQALSTFSLSI